MKRVNVLKEGVHVDQYGKRYDLKKVTVWEAEHLIVQGCKDLEIVEGEAEPMTVSTPDTEGVRTLSPVEVPAKLVEKADEMPQITEGGKVKVPNPLMPNK